MKFNKSDSAKMAGITRSTLDTHIKQGKVSATKNQKGQFEIEIAELERVYGDLKPLDNQDMSNDVQIRHDNTSSENRVLEVQLKATEQLLKREQETVEDLRKRLDQSDDERRRKDAQVTALLTDQSKKADISFIQGVKNFLGIPKPKEN